MLNIFVLMLAFATITLANPHDERPIVPKSIEVNSDEMIDFINSINTTWKAGRNFAKDTPKSHFARLCGVRSMDNVGQLSEMVHKEIELPEQFDSRTGWPECSTIGVIRDQGACGSCWAFGAVEAISDRICIHSKGSVNVNISAEDLTSCCTLCGFGCNGGIPTIAWLYYVFSGLVSGGLYNSSDGCLPYSIAACAHETDENTTLPLCGDTEATPLCTQLCEPNSPKVYHQDKHYGALAYFVWGEQWIMTEILLNGPVEGIMTVYSDFPTYKSGVYIKHSTQVLGGHAFKILGWGVEDGVKYWLCANSWNEDWGDKGYFKIRRGTNECDIESMAVAGLPKL